MKREPDDLLAQAIDAVRAEVNPDDQALARQTRIKLLEEAPPRWWHATPRLAWIMAGACFVMAPLGWAAATGRLIPVWDALLGVGGGDRNKADPAPQDGVRQHDTSREVAPVAPIAPLVQPTVTNVPAKTTALPRAASMEDQQTRTTPDKAQQMFAAAHELHFRGGEPARALQAWDTYLAFAPTGAFAVEARYNRALALIRLERRDEAAAALAPFASRQVSPSGYRQREAAALIEALTRAAPEPERKKSQPLEQTLP